MAKRTYYMRSKDGAVFSTSFPEYHQDCEQLTEKAGMDARREYCIAELRKVLKPGSTVYTMVRNVSKSGMSRAISLYIVDGGEIRCIDSTASDILLYSLADGGGLRVSGCGMDMGFATVYSLSRYLFREGFGVQGKNANGASVTPKTARQAKSMVARGCVFSGRNMDASGWDNDGGYALTQRWL